MAVVASGLYSGSAATADEPAEGFQESAISASTVGNYQNAEIVTGLTADPDVAAQLPHEDLNRAEALDLAQSVFGSELQAPAGPFDELHIEKYLADNVALIAPEQQPGTEEPNADPYEGPTILDSSVPLRTKSATGDEEKVELSLESSEGELQPANPLVNVGLPTQLGDGVSLPESRIQIHFDGVREDVDPTTIAKSVAFYPNVSQDTDLMIAPTPTGVETFDQIRSADGSMSQTLAFDMPSGMSIDETDSGGAELHEGTTRLLSVEPPTAMDAAGNSVPADLAVDGNAVKLTVTPEATTQFPILLDPLIQSYNWIEKPREGINGNTGGEEWTAENFGETAPIATTRSAEVNVLGVHATLYPGKTGEHAQWHYTVPRYYNDLNYYPNKAPTSFITHMTLSHLRWWANSEQMSPYLKAGLWDTEKGEWVSLLSHEGLKEHTLNDLNHFYEFNNAGPNTNVRMASVGMWLMENVSSYDAATVEVAIATVELSDNDNPVFGSFGSPSQWVDQTPQPFEFSATDSGLGIYSMTLSNGQNSWKTLYGCVGVSGKACPRTWSGPSSQPTLKYDPSVLPQGVDTLNVVAEDPLGHVSVTGHTQVKVDHSAPELSLGGTLTEQPKLGSKRANYVLKLNAAD